MIALGHHILEPPFIQNLVHKTQLIGQDLVEDGPANRSFHRMLRGRASLSYVQHLDLSVQVNFSQIVSQGNLIEVSEDFALATTAILFHGEIIAPHNHVLVGAYNGLTVGWLEQVVRG